MRILGNDCKKGGPIWNGSYSMENLLEWQLQHGLYVID